MVGEGGVQQGQAQIARLLRAQRHQPVEFPAQSRDHHPVGRVALKIGTKN